MARKLTGTLALGLCLITTTCWALYRVIDKGEWPSTWPKELEVLRKQSRTLVGPKHENRHYAIPFASQEEFEKLWPLLLSVKTKDAPVMLVKGPNFFLGKESKAGVVVHCPPEDESKTFATPSEPINSDNYRQLLTHSTYIELVVDGKIIDLNRIQLSTDCLVVDQRFNNPG
jgi:hypothetical protein